MLKVLAPAAIEKIAASETQHLACQKQCMGTTARMFINEVI
jgi:hypothetical protein